MTEDRVDERKTAAPVKIDELFRMKMSEFNARRDAGLISSKQLKSLNKALSKQVMEALGGEYATQERFAQALEEALPMLEEGWKFYKGIDSMSASELLDLRDAAQSDVARRRKARETGSQGGTAREGKRYSAKDHAYWKQLAAQLCPGNSPHRAAIRIADYLDGTLPPGDAPKMRTVYPILLADQSWQFRAKLKNR